MKEKENKQPFFTMKRKGIASLICAGAAVLWLILWQIFPMPFYSLFFASMVGSNLLLAALAAILTFPFNFLFSKTLKTDISAVPQLIINIICMMAFIYLYSIFRYTAIIWVILGFAVHAAATVILFAVSSRRQGKKTLRQTITAVLTALASAALTDSLYLLLFTALLNIFRE